MRFLRFLLGVTRRGRIKHNDVQEKLQIQNISEEIRIYPHETLYLSRTPDTRLSKVALK